MSYNQQKGLYFFFSIDIVNSTLLKNSHPYIWHFFYEEFYGPIRRELQSEINRTQREERLQFTFLKALGDELIFYAKIGKSPQIVHYLNFALGKIHTFRKRYMAKYPLINFKGTCWFADTFVNNIISFADKRVRDFNGPQMDIGFRISKFSSVDRFVISLATVYCLSLMKTKRNYRFLNERETILVQSFMISFYKSVELKGVDNSQPYPVFFLNRDKYQDIQSKDLNDSVGKSLKPIDSENYIHYFETHYIKKINSLYDIKNGSFPTHRLFPPLVEGDDIIPLSKEYEDLIKEINDYRETSKEDFMENNFEETPNETEKRLDKLDDLL